MPPLFGTSTSYRLARIAALVVGSLLFLYACERSRSTMFSDVWVEILLAAAFGMAGIGAAWFEIMIDERSARNGKTRAEGLHFDTGERIIRGRIARSGNLVLHGRDLDTDYEWSWTFRPAAFPAIRAALGDDGGDLLKLLEKTIPQLDRDGQADPGAWLRAQEVPATYREKGDNPTEVTRELPVLKLGLPKPGTRGRNASAEAPRQRAGAAERQRNAQPASERSRRRQVESEPELEAPGRRSRSAAEQPADRSPRKRPSIDEAAPSRRGSRPRREEPNVRREQHIPDLREDSSRRSRRPQADLSAQRSPDRSALSRRERPARNDSDRPARSAADRPARPAADRPTRSAADRPTRSAADRPARPASDRAPRRGQAVTDRPVQVPLNRLDARYDYDVEYDVEYEDIPRAAPSRSRHSR
ncbi:hypothetical protein [Nocardia sp. NPDC051832]|uniref:hypothetical protein n=1 Tax=Nocardia sp. NPDC051832 TaxID=3155673 RepID=UPI00341FD2E1